MADTFAVLDISMAASSAWVIVRDDAGHWHKYAEATVERAEQIANALNKMGEQ